MSERKDWKRLHKAHASKDDSTNRFPTPKDVVEGLVQRYGHGLKGKKIHCFADSRDSWFYVPLKENFGRLGLQRLVATEWVENGKGRQAAYDGQTEMFTELDDDGSLFGECSRKTTAECDVVFTNPPFKKYSAMLKDVVGRKDFVLLAPHILPYRMNDAENQIIYRIAKGEVFIEPKEIAIWNEDRTHNAKCVIVSTIKPEGAQKADIELSAKYDPAKHKMFIDAETGEPTDVVNCDRFKDFPVDWPGLVAIPATTLPKIANQKVRVIDVHGGFKGGGKKMELVDVIDVRGMYSNSPDGRFLDTIQAMELADSIAIHGFYGKGTGNPYAEFGKTKIIKVQLEDGRVPFQRIIVKLNRRAK